MVKKEKMRELLCAGLNEIIAQGLIDLNSLENVRGSTYCKILSKDSKIMWNSIEYGEVRVTIWWGVKSACKDSESRKPLNRDLREAVDVCCSAWLERKGG